MFIRIFNPCAHTAKIELFFLEKKKYHFFLKKYFARFRLLMEGVGVGMEDPSFATLRFVRTHFQEGS